MTIDTKRLASDPGYWDELKAPEDATHACIYSGGKWQWMRVNLSGPFNYYWHRRFSEWRRQESEVGEKIIPRPNKPAAPEYPRMAVMVNPHEAPLHYGEEALGKEIEVIEWLPDESCYVVRFDWGLGVLHDSMVDFGLYDSRTKDQRQRDELIKIIKEADEMAYSFRPDDLADAILAKYNLTEK